AFLPGSYYSRATGPYETGSTWSTTSYLGAASVIPPTNGSDVYVGNGFTVTAATGTKTIKVLQIDATSTLDIQTTTGYTVTTFNGAGTLKLASGTFPTVTTNNFITTAGNTVEYSGSGNYSLPASISTYRNLTFSGTGTKTLQANTTVNTTLTLNAGIVDIAGYNMILPVGSSLAGNPPSSSNMIRISGAGVVRRHFDVTNSSFNFPVGTGSVYTPFNLTFTGATLGGVAGSRYVDVKAVSSTAPSQLDATYSITKHWVVSATNFSNVTGSITATYASSEANATPGVEAIYGSAKYIGGVWTTGATSTVVARVITFPLAGATIIGNYTAGPNVGFLPGTFYSFATGNYETSGTWSLTGFGGPVSPIPPTTGSNIQIGNNRVVTATSGGKTVPTVTIDGLPNPGTLDLQTYNAFTFTTLNGSGVLKLASGTFPTVTTNNFITTAGNTVEYSGSGNYNLPSAITTYRNLTFSGTGTKTLQANTTVNTTLTLNSGIVDIAGYNLVLPVGSSLAGNPPSSSNMIRTSGAGVVRRHFDVTNSSFNFPVGTGTVYTPFNLTFTGATLGGVAGTRYVNVKAVNTLAPSQLDNSYSITKHWVVSGNNFSNVTGTITATYDASEANATPGVEAIYGSAKYISSAWTTGATSTVVARVISFPLSAATIAGNYTAGPNVGFLPGTFYSFATGNYETAGTWSLAGYVGPVSPIPPTIGSSIQVGNNRIVTATSGSKTVPNVTIDGSPNPGTLDLQAFNGFTFTTLTGSGTLKLASGTFPTVSTNDLVTTPGSTIEYYGSTTYSLPASPLAYRNLTITGSGHTKTLAGNTTVNENLVLNSGTLETGPNNLTVTGSTTLAGALTDTDDGGTNTFTGNLTINSTGSISTSNNSPFTFGGNITNNGTLSKTGTGAVTFNGGTQTIDGSNPITMTGSTTIGTGTTVQNSNNGFVLSNISIGQNGRLRQQYSSFPTSYTGSNDGSMIQTGFEVLSTSNNAGNAISSTSGDD
ncbi:MAG TPA: hypothetical protein PK509_16170, partial [Catalimonadaceae bacterium]|nr:hypothetical protein [Catalimonadaceae bacterium]